MRDFEKISFREFKKDIEDNEELYNSYKLPSRNSTNAAGYDFYLIKDILKIKTSTYEKGLNVGLREGGTCDVSKLKNILIIFI